MDSYIHFKSQWFETKISPFKYYQLSSFIKFRGLESMKLKVKILIKYDKIINIDIVNISLNIIVKIIN